MFGWITALTLVVAGRTAWAGEPRRVRLEYQIPDDVEGCHDRTAMRNAVAARLGYDPFADAAAESITARIARRGTRLVGALEIRDAEGNISGSREITASRDDCGELSSAMSLAISIAIDPLSLTRPVPAPPAASCPPAPTPVCPPAATPEPPTPSPEPDEDHPIRWRASLGAIGSLAAAPAPAFGLTAQLGVRWRALSVGIEGRVDFPASDETAVGEVASSLRLVSLLPCGHISVLMGCGMVSVGALQGENVAVGIRDSSPYAAAGIRAGVEITPYAPFMLRFHSDVLATLTRIVLEVDGREAWRTPVIQGVLGGALAGDFQ